jgi:hypothetical protein
MAPVEGPGRPYLGRRLNPIDASIGSTVDIFSVSVAERVSVACLLALAMYNSIEMVFLVFLTFKRRRGLYFWSMLVASCGCGFFALGFVVNDFKLAGTYHLVPALMTVSGWTPMITGQSLVLYSRLHLLCYNVKKLRLVRNMILFNALTMHVPIAVLVIGSNSSNPTPFLVPYSIYEKVEVTVFFLQEVVLSGMYLRKCFGFLRHARSNPSVSRGSDVYARGILVHLMLVNVLVVALDITIIFLEFSGMYLLQTSYKAFVYSVKLKCEASILNKLVDFMRSSRTTHTLATITPGVRHAPAVEKATDWTTTLARTIGTTWGSSIACCEGRQGGESQPEALVREAEGVMGLRTPVRIGDVEGEITITQVVNVKHTSRDVSMSRSAKSRISVAGPSRTQDGQLLAPAPAPVSGQLSGSASGGNSGGSELAACDNEPTKLAPSPVKRSNPSEKHESDDDQVSAGAR